MYLKEYDSESGLLVAVCDKDLVGKRTIKCALDNEFIEEASVIFIGGVPHA